MKTSIIIILALCLAVSLWINREHPNPRPPSGLGSGSGGHSPEVDPSRSKTEAAVNALPKAETMDFSGTSLSDEAWKLEKPGGPRIRGLDPSAPAAVPTAVPGEGDFKLELPTSLPTLDTTDPSAAPATGNGRFRSLLTTPDGE